jgi:hypothetical protein
LKAPAIVLQVHIHAVDKSDDLRLSKSTSTHGNDIDDAVDDIDTDDNDDDISIFFNASLSDGSKEDSLVFNVNIKCS